MYSLKVFLLIGSSILLFNTIELTAAKNWAVILVGCDKYEYTYAFEAGAYKQYNSLVKNGIPRENIIVISPDSAAFNSGNPMPGLIAYGYDKEEFSADEPVNQYEDVPIDYRKAELSSDQFLQILSGNSSKLESIGSGRVVKSGPNDNIFLYLHTIGSRGFYLLNNRNALFADSFIPFIEELSEAKAFKNMFIYTHCTSAGSMFDNYMETDSRILTYSLGGRYNSFSMCLWNKYLNAWTATLQGFEHFTYLDKAISKNGAKETVLDLYAGSGLMSFDNETVHNLYGDFNLAQKPIKEFYGPNMKNSQLLTMTEIMELKKEVSEQTKDSKSILKLLTEEEPPKREQERIAKSMNQVINESIKNTNIPKYMVEEHVKQLPLEKFGCYRKAIETMRSKCLTKDSEFVFLKYAPKFATLCSMDVPQQKIVTAIEGAC